ncbi:MAG: M15 family metallopeptidase [Gemmatimonadetes bacterium]|nr:M15 family metallopeptidase [Gemmatimonadota bacterium]
MINPMSGSTGTARAGSADATAHAPPASDAAATRAAFARMLQRFGGQVTPVSELEAVPVDGIIGETGPSAAPAGAGSAAIAREGERTAALRTLVERVAAPDAAPARRTSPVPLMPPVEPANAPAVRVDTAEPRRTERRRRADTGTAVSNAMAALEPAFRLKVERVIERMRTERGREVTVQETRRSQERQDALYEQGRTSPGAVVTWTRNSRHTDGMAADLQVDGTWDDPEGYAQLQQVAREEGLVTLGAKDPGHIEMSADDALKALGEIASVTKAEIGVARPVVSGGIATPAGVAQVARVATVANIAPVATVAAVGQVAAVAAAPATAGAPASVVAAAAGNGAGPVITTTVAAPGAGASDDGAGSGGSRSDSQAGTSRGDRAQQLAAALRGGAGTNATDSLFALAGANVPSPLGAGAVARALAGTNVSGAAARAADIMALQDARDARPVSHMLLQVENAAGGQDRIRVDVRGQQVGATMVLDDAAAAEQAASRMNELATALGARGLSADALRVRAAGGPAGDLARILGAVAADPSQLRAPASAAALPMSFTRQGGEAGTGGRAGTPNDSTRHRSRREPHGGQP